MIIERIKNVINNFTKKKKKDKEIPVYRNKLLIQDLDKFFKEIYAYYYLGGYKYIKKQIILDIIIYLFTVHFVIFIFFGIDWDNLVNINKLNIKNFQYINNTIIPLNNSNFTNNTNIIINNNNTNKINITNITINNTVETIYELKNYFSFSTFHKHKIIAIIIYLLFMQYLINYFYSSILFLLRMKYIKNIYENKFYLKSKDLEIISFNHILDLLIDLQNKENFCRIKDKITKYDIISRICRKDNYVTAMSFFNLFNFKIFGLDLMTNFIYHGIKSNYFSLIFNESEADINKNFYNKKIFKISMIFQILFQIIRIPPEIILRITFFLIKNVDKFQSKENIYKNRWNRTNLLNFKNYNELKHHFRKRISKSYIPTNKFLLCFGDKNISIFFHTIKLVVGYLLLFCFIIIFFLGTNTLQMKIYNKSFISVSIILLIIISLINYFWNEVGVGANTVENFDETNKYFKEIVKYIQNMPSDWGKKRIYKNYKFIEESYINNFYHFIIEIISVLFQPILWIKLINNYDTISSFIRTFSIDLEGIGTVCSFSVLNLKEFLKVQEKASQIFKINKDKNSHTIKFINSLIYFEKYFSLNESYAENNINNNKNIEDDKNEIIIVDDERIDLKVEEYQDKRENENSIKIVDYISEKLLSNYKGNINLDNIKENISYFINIENNMNFNEIIKNLYDKKYGYINI